MDYFTLWAVPKSLAALPDRNIYSHDNQRILAAAARTGAAHGSPAHRRVMAVSDGFYQGRIDATGSPLAYATIGLTSSGDYDDDVDRFTIASFVAFLISIGLLCRLLDYSATGAVLAAVAYGLCFSPLLADLRVVNVNQLQLLCLSLFLWLQHSKKAALAGVVLGLGIAFKPNIAAVLVLAAVVAVVDGRMRERVHLFLGAIAGIALGVIAAAAYFGSFDVWGRFVTSVARTLQVGYPLQQGNYALASLVATLTSAEVSVALAILAGTAVLIVLLRTRRRNHPAPSTLDEHFLVTGLGCIVMLLGSRLVWVHYFVLLIPLSLYLLRPPGAADGRRRVELAAAGVALLLLSPAVQVINDTPLFVAVTANIATALLFCGGLYSWSMARRSAIPSRSRRPSVRLPR